MFVNVNIPLEIPVSGICVFTGIALISQLM